MNEMENARLLLICSRLFFKDSLKTDNKTYSPSDGSASEEKKLKRRANAPRSSEALGYLRKTFGVDEFAKIEFLGFIPEEKRAGNSSEYISVALKHGCENKIPNIWLIIHSIHSFLVLATDPGLSDTLALSEFCQYKDYNYWVCDPWFNIHCKMQFYGPMVNCKSCQWESEGKEIGSSLPGHFEQATKWCQKLFIGNMQAIRMTDSSGQPTAALKDKFGRLSSFK